MKRDTYLEAVFANIASSCRPEDVMAARLIAGEIRDLAASAVENAIPLPFCQDADFAETFKRELGCEKKLLSSVFRALYGERTLVVDEEGQRELDVDFDGIAAAALDELPVAVEDLPHPQKRHCRSR